MKRIATALVILALSGGLYVARANPTVTTQPVSRSNNVGDNAQFTVTATGTGLTYQWQFNTGNISGATTTALNVGVTDTSKAGSYTVVVTDNTSTSVTSSVAVLSLPFGNRYILSQWNFDNAPPGDGNVQTGVTTPSIATAGGTFGLVSVSQNTYRAGTSSDPASLGNDNSARNFQGPATTVADRSGGFQVTGVSTIGYRNIAVTWELYGSAGTSAYWRGEYTTNGTDWVPRVAVNKKAAYQLYGLSYTFHSDDLSDVPEAKECTTFGYRVVAEYDTTATGSGTGTYVSLDGGAYSASASTRIDMFTFLGAYDNNEVQPVVTASPQNQTVVVGDNVTFSVSATGGDLVYYWRTNGQFFRLGTITSPTSGSLTITNAQLTNAGTYSVIVSNSQGTATSSDALLTVVGSLGAGDRFWSADGTTAGGSGTWDNTTANRWGLSAGGPFDLRWYNRNPDNANFVATGAAPGAVTVGSGGVTVNRMNITNASGSATYSFGGGAITLSNDAAIYVAGGNGSSGINSVFMSCLLSGPVVTKTGGGRLTIANTGNTVGQYVISQGIISATTGSQFGVAPTGVLTNYFTIDDGAGIGFAGQTSVSITSTRGIYLRGNGKLGVAGTVASPSTLTLSGPITGPGGVSFPDFNSFPGGDSGAGGKFILNNSSNNWQGPTTVTVGELRVGVDGALSTNTSITLNGGSGANVRGRLNVNGFNAAVQNVVVSGSGAMIFDSVGTGSLSATNYDVQQSYTATNALSAVLAGNADLTKTTGGTAGLWGTNTYTGNTWLLEGTINLNGIGTFGNGAGTLYVIGTNSSGQASAAPTITLTQTRTPATTLLNPVVVTAAESQIQSDSTATGAIVLYSGGPWTMGPGALYLVNGSTDPSSSFTLGLTSTAQFDSFAGVSLFTDSVQLSSLNPAGTDQTFNGVISGSGSFRRSVLSGAGGRTIFTADNTYSGPTIIEAGTLLVDNTTIGASGTGSGAVTVSGPGGLLGGHGTVGGAVTVTVGGTIAAGSSVGALTLQNGLDLSGGGANIWELGALKDNLTGVAGVDFDQLVLTGGELVLGGSSQLLLQFASGLTPSSVTPFWQSAHSWTLVRLNGGNNAANATFASVVNGSYNAGNFSTAVSGGGDIVLNFTPNPPSAPHVTLNPLSRTNVVGTTASFTVAATGSDPLGYVWYRLDAPFIPISGATNATYVIPNVQFAQAGDYFARVTNSLGNDVSQTAKLTVVARPQMQSPAGAGTANVTLTWPTVPDTSYQVQYNTNLATANWYVLTNVVASGSSLSVTDHPPVASPKRFYRLLIH